MNTGLRLDLEKEHQNPDTDWIYGAVSVPCIAQISPGERENCLPIGEIQNKGEEKYDCATRSPLNIYEAKFTWLYWHSMLPENRRWLEQNGYVVDNRVTFSDAFIAILSDTAKNKGNSLIKPIDTIHVCGLIPKKMLPQTDTFASYYDPNRITNDMLALGKEFKSRFPLNYERVYEPDFGKVLESDFISTAGYAWTVPVNDEYPNPGDMTPNHAFAAFNLPKYLIFDNYLDTDNDFIKKLAPDYNLVDFGYRCYVSAETSEKDRGIQLSVLDRLMQYGLWSFFKDWFNRFVGV